MRLFIFSILLVVLTFGLALADMPDPADQRATIAEIENVYFYRSNYVSYNKKRLSKFVNVYGIYGQPYTALGDTKIRRDVSNLYRKQVSSKFKNIQFSKPSSVAKNYLEISYQWDVAEDSGTNNKKILLGSLWFLVSYHVDNGGAAKVFAFPAVPFIISNDISLEEMNEPEHEAIELEVVAKEMTVSMDEAINTQIRELKSFLEGIK